MNIVHDKFNGRGAIISYVARMRNERDHRNNELFVAMNNPPVLQLGIRRVSNLRGMR